MRTIFISFLFLSLVCCSPDSEPLPVDNFDSQAVQSHLVGRWIYFAKADASSPNDLTYVSGVWESVNSYDFANIDTLEFRYDMNYVQTFTNAKFEGRYEFTQTYINLFHGLTVDVFQYSFDNYNTLRLGIGKDFSTFKVYRRE